MMMTVGAMGIQSAEVIARQEEADSVDRQELQSEIYPRAGGRRVRKRGAMHGSLARCTIGAAHEGRGSEEKEVDTVDLAGDRNIPDPYSVTGRKAEGCMAMVRASIIMRRTGEQ